MENGELLFEKTVPLSLDEEKFERAPERDFERGNIPRLVNIFIDRPGIDRVDRGVQVRIGGGEDANDSGAKLAGLLPVYHVYARLFVYQTQNVVFYQIPDRILSDFGLDLKNEPFADSDD